MSFHSMTNFSGQPGHSRIYQSLKMRIMHCFMYFNRTQSRAIIGLLTGHNTLRKYLHLLRLLDSPLCRRCGVKEQTSGHILCECEALASLTHVYLGSFFLDPGDTKA
jgi:hypothetical protein